VSEARALLDQLKASQWLLAEELVRRGIALEEIDLELGAILARGHGRAELLVDVLGRSTPYASALAADSKHASRVLLSRAGLSVPRSGRFSAEDVDAALGFARSLGGPVVAKSLFGAHGTEVFLPLVGDEEVREAIERLLEKTGYVRSFLIEELVEGRDLRIFVTAEGWYAALLREPPSVVGDGVHSVRELVDRENTRRMSPRINCLCPILLDAEVDRRLQRAGRALDAVPAAGEGVVLRNQANVGLGAMCEDLTDALHPSLVEIALAALRAVPDLDVAGLDVIARDPRAEASTRDYRIIEMNALPGIGMHMAPGRGAGRDLASVLADRLFPETRRFADPKGRPTPIPRLRDPIPPS
jgi:cyanophycin synthetase